MEKPEIPVEKPEIPVKKPTILERLKLFFVKVDTRLKIVSTEGQKPLNNKTLFIFLGAFSLMVVITEIICRNDEEVISQCSRSLGKALFKLLYVIIEILLEGK